MNRCLPDEATARRLIAEIESSTPRPHHASLLAAIHRLIPEAAFRFALTRGGWYRPGGIVRAEGGRVADSVEDWVARELAECGDDPGEFMDRHAEGELIVTRHTGRTHYFVAPQGSEPAAFLQIEVEEMQEVHDRRLWDAAAPPADVQELIDPIKPAIVPAQAVGAPRYRFRRLTDLRDVVARLSSPAGSLPALTRFMREWAHRGGGPAAHFCEHWVVALREHHDRYHNAVLTAVPVSQHVRDLKPFHWNSGARGLDMATQLRAFDRAAGYPAAWYFHLVAGGLAPREMASPISQDLDSGFGYLSDSEVALLRGWLREPYAV